MHDIIAISIVSIAAIALVGCIWMLICNSRTYKQRVALINWVFDGSGNWRARERAFDSVTYDQHLWALVTFRNPNDLYNFEELG